MKLNDVHITNWEAPGDAWWKEKEERHSEPLIEATMNMTLTMDEYKFLCACPSGEKQLLALESP